VDIDIELFGEIAAVAIAGDIDALTAGEAIAFLNVQLERGRDQLVLDLGQVRFMSSAGIRLLLEISRKCREQGGDLRLAQTPAGVARTLEITGLARILKAYPSVDEAVSSFTSRLA
jgi:anti-sigma B factor antagonist